MFCYQIWDFLVWGKIQPIDRIVFKCNFIRNILCLTLAFCYGWNMPHAIRGQCGAISDLIESDSSRFSMRCNPIWQTSGQWRPIFTNRSWVPEQTWTHVIQLSPHHIIKSNRSTRSKTCTCSLLQHFKNHAHFNGHMYLKVGGLSKAWLERKSILELNNGWWIRSQICRYTVRIHGISPNRQQIKKTVRMHTLILNLSMCLDVRHAWYFTLAKRNMIKMISWFTENRYGTSCEDNKQQLHGRTVGIVQLAWWLGIL